MKKKYKYIILILILLLLFILFYLFYLRDWSRPVNVDVSVMQEVTYFHDQPAEQYGTLFSSLCEQHPEKEKVETGPLSFTREIEWANDEKTYLSIVYQFQGEGADQLNSPADYLSSADAGMVIVSIYSVSEKDSLYTSVLQSLKNATDEIQLKKEMSKEYGKFRPIYNLFVKKGSKDDFAYYITPYNRCKNEYGMTDGDDCVAYAFFRFGEYQINLYESTNDVTQYQCMPLVLQDLADLFREAQKAS